MLQGAENYIPKLNKWVFKLSAICKGDNVIYYIYIDIGNLIMKNTWRCWAHLVNNWCQMLVDVAAVLSIRNDCKITNKMHKMTCVSCSLIFSPHHSLSNSSPAFSLHTQLFSLSFYLSVYLCCRKARFSSVRSLTVFVLVPSRR